MVHIGGACTYHWSTSHFGLSQIFHFFTENFRLVGSPYFILVTKKNFYQIFRMSFEYVPEYVSYVFLDTERELDLVQSQVFLEVEKNPLFYHNLLTLNF